MVFGAKAQGLAHPTKCIFPKNKVISDFFVSNVFLSGGGVVLSANRQIVGQPSNMES